jgi:putative effector of murein hydrolase
MRYDGDGSTAVSLRVVFSPARPRRFPQIMIAKAAGVLSPRTRGLAIGVSAHGIGTAYALSVDAETGAASAGMAFSGVLTGLLLPTLWGWLMPG